MERVGSQKPGVRQLQLYAALLQALAALGIQGLMTPNEPLLQASEVCLVLQGYKSSALPKIILNLVSTMQLA